MGVFSYFNLNKVFIILPPIPFSVPPGLGIGSLAIGLLVRVLFTFVCVLCAGFNFKEKLFIALAWLPKATVQVLNVK